MDYDVGATSKRKDQKIIRSRALWRSLLPVSAIQIIPGVLPHLCKTKAESKQKTKQDKTQKNQLQPEGSEVFRDP
jgi:hypothetical protein